MANPKIYFLKFSDGDGLDSTMEEAFLACKSQQTETILCDIAAFQDIHSKHCKSNPQSTIIVVTNKFLSDDFNRLKKMEHIKLVGPLCVLACLNNGISIPNSKEPLLNIAMKSAIVCCSGLPKDKKARIKELVQLMTGQVTDDFLANTTHLITDSVITVKYAMAAEKGICIMAPSWIDAIWKESQDRVVSYDNVQFMQYRCPVFHNLRICATGIARLETNDLASLIRKNGGTFSCEMALTRTDVLICAGDNIHNSSKYKAVISKRGAAANIRCLSLKWLYESIKTGYSLPDDDYAIPNQSTPKSKVNKENIIDPQMFLISRINDTDTSIASCATIDASYMRDNTKPDISTIIDISALKQASTFLDGCYIYLICFTGDDLVFLQRVLKYTGATRLDSFSNRVTHVVVGDYKSDAYRQELRSLLDRVSNQLTTHIVYMGWLVESITKQSILAEDTYVVSVEMSPQGSHGRGASPLCKRGLTLLRSNTSVRAEESTTALQNSLSDRTDFKTPDELQQYMLPENETLARYWNDVNTEDLEGVDTLKNAAIEQSTIAEQAILQGEHDESDEYVLKTRKRDKALKKTSVNSLSESSITTPLKAALDANKTFEASIFSKKTFQLLQFATANMDELTRLINRLGGCVVSRTTGSRSYRGVTDYAIVPIFSDREVTRTLTAEHVLSDIWVRECADKGVSVDPLYYHQCVTEPACEILDGCVVSSSGYTKWEQTYLFAIIDHLGGRTQGDLSKKLCEDRGLLATTHLITSKKRNNKKYDGAKRWGIPVVGPQWIKDCLRTGKRLPEALYPVLTETIDNTFASPNPVPVLDKLEKTKEQPSYALDSLEDPTINILHNECSRAELTDMPVTPQVFATPKTVTPCNDVARKRMISVPDTPQFQSPIFSQHTPSQVSPVTRKYNEVMDRIKAKVEQGLLYDSDTESPSSTRLSEQRTISLNSPVTADSPFTAKILGPNATFAERKELKEFFKKIPNNTPPPQVRSRRYSTPLSELKRRFAAKCDENYEKECQKLQIEAETKRAALEQHRAIDAENDDVFMKDGEMDSTNVNASDPALVEEKMRHFVDKLATPIQNNKQAKPTTMTPVTGTELPDSQTYSVGYDYGVDESAAKTVTRPLEKDRVFLITGCQPTDKDVLQEKIVHLGARVASEQTNFDNITHLLCTEVLRNEKTLCSIASGKWVLHVNYIEESFNTGKFLDEELFEFGNPKSKINVENKDMDRARIAVYWRQTVEKMGKGAFHDMRAIVVNKVKGNTAIANVIEAGGGAVVDSRPPYDNNDYATHCLIESKSTNDLSDFVQMAKRGIYCVPHIYLYDFLMNKNLDITKAVIPKLAPYYSK